MVQSGVPQLEYFILYYLEVLGIPTREHAVSILIFHQLILTSTIVAIGEVGILVAVAIPTIGNAKVMTTPKDRTIAGTVNQVIIPLGHKLLPHVQREDEGPAPAVDDVLTKSV